MREEEERVIHPTKVTDDRVKDGEIMEEQPAWKNTPWNA